MSKPLGKTSLLCDSILSFGIQHREITNTIDFYNAWVEDLTNDYGIHGQIEPENIPFLLTVIESTIATPLDRLIVCRQIEDSYK